MSQTTFHSTQGEEVIKKMTFKDGIALVAPVLLVILILFLAISYIDRQDRKLSATPAFVEAQAIAKAYYTDEYGLNLNVLKTRYKGDALPTQSEVGNTVQIIGTLDRTVIEIIAEVDTLTNQVTQLHPELDDPNLAKVKKARGTH